jgi:diacylglycerol kinase (ATP)
MTTQKFSIRRRFRSFRWAIAGIRQFIRDEHNARIHLAATIAVVIAAFFLHVSRLEAAALALAIGGVWATELLNTSLERMADLISVEQHPTIKFIKDLGAGAVLVAAFTAVIVGLLIFIPKLI